MTKNKAKHEPLFHVVRRTSMPAWQSISIRALSILAAFLVCCLILLIAYQCDPITFISSLFNGVFGTERRIWLFLYDLAILLGISLALVPAFKMKFWNIGADGQTLIGGLGCVAVMHYLGGVLPDAGVIAISLVVSILAGGIWGLIPAFFKARFKTNETLFTLMMNYIAIQLVSFFINTWVSSGTGVLKPIDTGNLPTIGGNTYLLTIILVAILLVFMSVYLRYSKHGFELSLVGENENTARYAGINVRKVIIRTMLLSGVICGVMGFLMVSGYTHTISTSLVNGRGFTGVIVTWLSGFNPLYMVLTSVLFVFLSRGTSQVITNLGITNSAIQNIVIGIFYFCIIGFEFFIRYQVLFTKNGSKRNSSLVKGLEVKAESKEA
ncbi:MAG: ABC transporter permease [Bacilli bacterium]